MSRPLIRSEQRRLPLPSHSVEGASICSREAPAVQQPIVGALHVLVQPPRRLLLLLRLATALGILTRLRAKPALRRGVVLQLLPGFRGLRPGINSALLCSRQWRF